MLCLSNINRFAILVFAILFTMSYAYADSQKRIIVGYVENVNIRDVNLKIKGKLDTGARRHPLSMQRL